MSRYFLAIFYALLLLLLHSTEFTVGFNGSRKSGVVKCRETERQALLSFKHGLEDESGMLSTWSHDEDNRDCCNWNRIQCNYETGHVRMLHLRGHHTQYLIGEINFTYLIHLPYLEYLDLIYATLYLNIPQFMGSFVNLKYLNLSDSIVAERIPSQLGDLSQLEYLDLRDNIFSGAIPFQIGNLRQLQYLDLGGNMLSGAIPFQFGNLRQLVYLNLARNTLSGAIPFQTGNLPLLHTLRLGGNFDIRAKDAEWLSNLYSLTILELTSLHNLGSSRLWLQTIRDHIPNLREL
ncbi:DNA damage-repair/toleration protein DRT100, partial [Mucuna pruriens]